MACVPGEVAGHFVVALEAGLVAAHAAGELVVGIALVHRVATDARHLAALITGRLEQAVVLAAGDANHSIGPKAIAQPLAAGVRMAVRLFAVGDEGAGVHDGGVGVQFIAGQKAGAIPEPVELIGGVLVRVALAAGLCR